MDGAHTDDGSLQGGHITGNNPLQGADDLRGGQYRVDGKMRGGAVPAFTHHFDLEDFCPGHGWAIGNAEPTDRLLIPEMQAEHHIHFGVFENTAFDHLFCAPHAFLGWLEHEFYCPGQFIAVGLEHFGHRQQDGSVPVMPAGVHDAGILGCIHCAGLFEDWQGVHVGAHQDDRAGFCAFEQCNHTCPGDTGMDFQPERS